MDLKPVEVTNPQFWEAFFILRTFLNGLFSFLAICNDVQRVSTPDYSPISRNHWPVKIKEGESSSITVQAGLYRTWSDTQTVLSCSGSNDKC